MVKEQSLEDMRRQLNDMLALENPDPTEVLKLSQELDILIVEEMKIRRDAMKKSENKEFYEVDINKLLEAANFLGRTYDVLRVVDPLNKKVIEYKENKRIESSFHCYSFWSRGEICENCISIRALKQDKIFIKVENTEQVYYITIAVPVILDDNKYVAEFSKNITPNLIIYDNKFIQRVFKELSKTDYMQVRDSSTGLYNDIYIEDRLPYEIMEIKKEYKSLSLILVCINSFKKIINANGQALENIILKAVAAEITNSITKEFDWIARYGEDEFFICTHNTNLEATTKIAETIREKIESKIIIWEEKKISITLNFSIFTVFDRNENVSADSVMENLRTKLSVAKAQRYNNIV